VGYKATDCRPLVMEVDSWMYGSQLSAVTMDYRRIGQAGIAGHPLLMCVYLDVVMISCRCEW